ncbi:MAG: glycosyltransferase [Crocinitomicaceae bacterium]|nr:glycosyltransferase [Crocinitomicaceae bacterium]MBK8925974.1 glycosyltransferase [Crocinitomicaceae bacterium]
MNTNHTHNDFFSLVLPCFNPPTNWEKIVVSSVKSIIEKTGIVPQLILVNDGSVKNTEDDKIEFIKNNLPDFTYIQYPINKGKGHALRQGVAAAKYNLIIYTDIDFPYLEKSFLGVYQKLSEGYDVVPGHRGNEYYSKTPFLRKLISKFLRWTLKTFLRLPTDDSQCGIKGFNKNGAAVFLETKIDRFLFDLEFIKLASKRKLKFSLAEVELKPDVVFSKVNMRILLRESINFLKVLWR